jgi:DNA-binding beta-propeller fold protein YncE
MGGAAMSAGPKGRSVFSSFSAPVSRRAFLVGAAAVAVSGRTLSRIAYSEPNAPAFLHLAAYLAGNGHVHTYAVTGDKCEFLGSTNIDSFSAYASHPTLSVLYIARDCSQWEHLPRGVIETYRVERSAHPLRLLVQTPMALSATGPRSLAVSNCGRYLLVSASTGRAWNAFVLGSDGIPASVAIARKETGSISDSRIILSPAPHAVAFSPTGPCAVGTDPSSNRMTLLNPSPDGIAILSRRHAPFGVAELYPTWTYDGRYVVAADAHTASLSLYAIRSASGDKEALDIHLFNTAQTETPIKALLAHATEAGVFTSRGESTGSRLEFWKIRGHQLAVERDAWIPDNILAIAHHAGCLWLASENRLFRMKYQDLRAMSAVRMAESLEGVRMIVTQSYGSNLI